MEHLTCAVPATMHAAVVMCLQTDRHTPTWSFVGAFTVILCTHVVMVHANEAWLNSENVGLSGTEQGTSLCCPLWRSGFES